MRFLDLFAGIGGFRAGMEQAGHECMGHVEIDEYARRTYEAVHQPKEWEFRGTDITKITDEEWSELSGTIDIICGGFPCQAFSTAGKRRGFDDTRGTLFFEIARAAKQIKPPVLVFENVKGLLHHDKGRTFRVVLSTLDELGYDVEWQVLNSKAFGVPQNRERVFVIGHLRGQCSRKVFPIQGSYGENNKLQGQQTNTITSRYSGSMREGSYIIEGEPGNKIKQIGSLDNDSERKNLEIYRVYDSSGLSPTIGTMQGGNRQPKIIIGENECRIRKLTPRECWRLQGFPDWAFDRAKQAGLSDSQLYKQAGNAVTVNVVHAIGRKLICNEKKRGAEARIWKEAVKSEKLRRANGSYWGLGRG